MIPKRAMFFWANDRMSWLRFLSLYSFRKFNPDWEIELWGVQSHGPDAWKDGHIQQDSTQYTGEDYSHLVEGLGVVRKVFVPDPRVAGASATHLSEFFKWSSMFLFGGVFADMDILFRQPMPHLAHDTLCWAHGNFAIGIIAGLPGSSFFRDVYSRALRANLNDYNGAGVDLLNRGRDSAKVHLFPPEMFYPHHWKQVHLLYSDTGTPPLDERTVGLHWYAGARASQDINQSWSPFNLDIQRGVFADEIRRVIE